jgi:hypothetical protein
MLRRLLLVLAPAGLCVLPAQSPRRVLGTVTAAAPPEFTVKTDGGEIVAVSLAPEARVRKVAPGERDLTKAQEIAAGDIAVGDRVLVRGGGVAGPLPADSVIVMTAREITRKHEVEQQVWRERGTLGVAEEVDVSSRTIRMRAAAGPGRTETVTVQAGENCVFRRYAPDSVRFADALPSGIEEIRKGDQLRVLGDKDDTGRHIAAEQIVSGAFRSVAGRVLAVNAASGEFTLKDLQSGKNLAVRLKPDTRMKRFERPGMIMGGAAGPPGPGADRPDFAAMIERMPATTAAELKRGDTVIVSSAAGGKADQLTAIVVLANAEPLLSMLPASSNRNGRNEAAGPSIGSSLDRGLDGIMGGLMIQ